MKKRTEATGQQSIASVADIESKIAISSRVIVEDETGKQRRRKLHNSVPKAGEMGTLMERISTRIEDNRGMQELLPDLRLAKRILVPSILSPKDLVGVKLTIGLNTANFEKEIPADILSAIENHFRTRFDLESRLSKILEEVLFDVGSYTLVTVPENTLSRLVSSGKITGMESLQEVINGPARTEFMQNIGILGGQAFSTEALEITDNIAFLALEPLHKQLRSAAIRSKLSMESYIPTPVLSFDEGQGVSGKRNNNPLVFKAPACSIIPVHAPGDPTDHLGYYLVIDENGRPVTADAAQDNLSILKSQIEIATNNNALGGLMRSTGMTMAQTDKKVSPNTFIDQYVAYIEGQLEAQLKEGAYGSEVMVSRPNDVYYLMLSRVLAKKKTRLLYMPKEMVSYFAFMHDENGLGISLLEQTKVFGSLRALLLFADVMAGVKNSVGHTRLDVILDPDDPDHAGTLEAVVQLYTNLQTTQFPIGVLQTSDIVRALQKAGVDVNVDGGDAFPGTKTTVEDVRRDRTRPDETLRDLLRRMQYSGLGIPPEIVDSTLEGELATVVVSRNLMYAKQVMEYQQAYEPQLTHFVQTYVRCSGELINILKEELKKAKLEDDNEFLHQLISNLEVKLPSPDLAKVRNQMEAYNEYSEAIDRAMEAWLTEDMLGEMMEGDVNTRALQALRLSVGNVLKRDWMRRQNLFTEIEETFNDEDSPIANRVIDHSTDMVKMLGKVIAKVWKAENKANEDITKANEPPEPEPDPNAPAPGTDPNAPAVDGGDTGGDFGGDEGGFDEGGDTGGDDTGTGGEEPPAEGGEGAEGDSGDPFNF